MIKNNKKTIRNQGGFTLLELLVVMALLVILLSISLFNYSNFGRDVELENATYTTALAIRETQVYGINRALRKGTETNVKNTFTGKYAYGVFVKKNEDNLILFKDPEGVIDDGVYNESVSCGISNSECYSKINLTRGNKITRIISYAASSGPSEIDKASISFIRPDPDAIIKVSAAGTVYSRLDIEISDPTGNFSRCVRVGAAGDISILKTC